MDWLSLTWMGWQDWAGNVCYIILAISYAVSNIYWLRSLAMVALAMEMVYFFFGAERPLWVGIGWNVVFIGTNAIQLDAPHPRAPARPLQRSGAAAAWRAVPRPVAGRLQPPAEGRRVARRRRRHGAGP